MCAAWQSIRRYLLLCIIFMGTSNTYSQWTIPGSIQVKEIEAITIDTSEYIPYTIPGALDYNLMIASSKGYISEIERLIEKGADIEAQTGEGASALVFAVMNGRSEAVKTLLKYDPLLDKVTSRNETPLMLAVKNRNPEIAEILIRAGANIEFYDRHEATCLHHAAINGFIEMVDLLVYYNAYAEARTKEGTTPLLASIWAGNTNVSDLLIQNGASTETPDNDGFTPFLMAAFYGDTVTMNILKINGADIYATNNAGHNALTISIATGQDELTLFLLKIGDKWVNKLSNALDPYEVASAYHRKETVNILKSNNIPGDLKYGIDQISFTISTRFDLSDITTGISLAFKEPFLNAGFIAGLDTKLWETRILIQTSEDYFYQYRSKGSVAWAGLFKDFNLTDHPDRLNYSFSASLTAGYTFGNSLKGTLSAPEDKFLVIPSISLKMTKMNFAFNLGMEYIKTEYYKSGPVWVRAGVTYNYFFDNVRMKVKQLRWY